MPLSGFHPTVARWFLERLGQPTPAQAGGWPLIQGGHHTLIAAPTGSGKTLAAFLAGLDALLREGSVAPGGLPDETRLLYISPLKALSNDVQKNLQGPLAELRALDPGLPELRVLVRTGDTPAGQRTSMGRRPPHVLVTTPESLYILLTSAGGRALLRTVRTAIVDEVHALVRDKRGAHLALSLERLEALAGPFQRIGLSATQRPMEAVARFLVGEGRECRQVDTGHRRALDLGLEVPASPLETVCSHETWDELYGRMADLIREHTTTLVFVNTRKMAERLTARLADKLGEGLVTSHHGSLSRELRLEAERRLKQGELRALVATASLELGIDVGPVDLVIQVGSTRAIATFLQRVGRAGHGVGRLPKGRLFPLTRDELVEAAALLRAVRAGELDRLCIPERPLDILAQQVVAACAAEEDGWEVEALRACFARAWPYRALSRADLDAVIDLHAGERLALLHRDGVHDRVRATKRARLVAITSGGAIADTAQYRVVLEPDEAVIGSLDEDFSVEANAGDIFQLGNASWRILKIEPGTVRVASAEGAPPTIPFWLGEAPARTAELSAAVAGLREECPKEAVDGLAWLEREAGIGPDAGLQLVEYLAAGRQALGCVPTQQRLVLERFFDDSGGMQLVLHAPFGGRVNRALGLALRKRFCRGFGFELQAAANEDALVLSLGPHHSFPLEEVFDYLHPRTARDLLVQALLAAPMFTTRWRWNTTRALVVPRARGGKKTPAPLIRMRAEDELVRAFPQAQACFETLPPGDLPVPLEHPLVRQTVDDCLHEAMDVDGFLAVLEGLAAGRIERVALDTAEPSPFAHGILAAQPYTFLDDAPLEERRTQAVIQRRTLAPAAQDGLGALDPAAIARVREESWPQPAGPEEVHEALTWMGYVADDEAGAWRPWLEELARAGRVERTDGRWFAVEAGRDPVEVWRGRLEVLGPVAEAGLGGEDLAALGRLEVEGLVLRVRLDGQPAWCHRRLLARIQRYTLERLRREIEPVSAACFWRFLAAWQRATEARRAEGPAGLLEVARQLAGFEVPAAEWERSVLPLRVRGYRRNWLDELTLGGHLAWGRLWGAGAGPVKTAPICLLPREDLDLWAALAGPASAEGLTGPAAQLFELLATRGAQFPQDLARLSRLLPEPLERGLGELVGRGLVTCDSFAALRGLIVPPSRRRTPLATVGRWSPFRAEAPAELEGEARLERLARQLLARTGVVFKRTLARERLPVPWRDLHRVYRRLELRGDVRGGRFVSGFSGEQFALPAAIELLRRVRREGREGHEPPPLEVSAADPLNFQGVLTPEEKVARTARARVLVGR